MNKKLYAIFTAILIVVTGGAFYGGTQYQNNKLVSAGMLRGQGGPGGPGGQGRQGGGRQGMGGPANGGAGDFAGGQIIAKDDTSVTIKTRDGGSKIIFFSSTTAIDKSVAGATSDLSVGQQISANGKTSSDGSLTAQNIQIRPNQPQQ
jgi:hypothetical protein